MSRSNGNGAAGGGLSIEQRDEIIARLSERGVPVRAIAESFGLSRQWVHQIISKRHAKQGAR